MHNPVSFPPADGQERPEAIPARRDRGFTLTELLVVISIIVLMMSMAIPAFNAIKGGTDFTSVVYDIAGILDSSRAYAMSHNTFVLVGIMEVNGAQSSNASPQAAGVGRIAIAAIASNDGTRPYQAQIDAMHSGNGASLSSSIIGNGSRFTAFTKLITFNNMHIADLQAGSAVVPNTGNMARPTMTSPYFYYDVGNTSQCVSATPFGWPLGSSISGGTTPQYSFGMQAGNAGASTVIEFDPLGSARIITSNPSSAPLLDNIPQVIEIGLEPARGTAAATPSLETQGQIAAIQIDGMSGAVRIYRP